MEKDKNIAVSAHTHFEGPLCGSTIGSVIDRINQLGRTHVAVTDSGHLASILKVYSLCKPSKDSDAEDYQKRSLQLIPGIEFSFKDMGCEHVAGTKANRCKYYISTIYAADQESYQKISETVSRTDFPTIAINDENKQLWDWQTVRELSKYNTHLVLGGPHCIVAKNFLAGSPEAAMSVFLELKSLFNDRLSVSVIVEPWKKKYQGVVEIYFKDGTKQSLLSTDRVTTDKARRIKAIDLTQKSHHSMVKSVIKNGINTNIDKDIDKTVLHNGFLPLPGGDVTLRVNNFLYSLAKKHGLKTIVSDYSYYSEPKDKMVQTMRLEGKNKMHSCFYVKTEEDIRNYLITTMSLEDSEIDKIYSDTNLWANTFNGLQLKYEWRLAEVENGTAIDKIMEIVKNKGRMKWDNPMYVKRLQEELKVIYKNGIYDLSAYFLPIRDVLNNYTENGLLVGPGRGSSSGALLSYLMGITQIDPFRYDLPFTRFFSMVRIKNKKLPDIDCLSADTMISTEIGQVSISELSNMEEYPDLISFDTDNKEFISQKPELVFLKGRALVKEYTLNNGEKITCTPDHKVLTTDGRYLPIEGCFFNGIEIRSSNKTNSYIKITSAKEIGIVPVYDICMPNIHNFVASGIVVHNCDLEDRTFLVGEDGKSGYLYNRWGNKAAQIGTKMTMRLKSSILDTNRYINGSVEDSIISFTKGLPNPPVGISDSQFVFGYEDEDGHHVPGLIELSQEFKDYTKNRPKEWEIVSNALGISKSNSSHASAFVIADKPIGSIVPLRDGNITQYEAKEVESAGLIKYDFLVVKQLKDIRIAMELINKKHGVKKNVGYFTHQGKDTYIWDLPELPEVFQSVWSGKTETCFQINTSSMRPYVIQMLPNSIKDLMALLALVRPGPLDYIDPDTGRNMTEEYMLRREGNGTEDLPILKEILPDTYSIIVFQEDLNKIAKNVAGMSDEDAELLRENMAKKKMIELTKMKPIFIEGASKRISKEEAENLWERMVTFGKYGFSIIHACAYAHITYACMFLKHFYPLEWWAAILTNATEQEITGKFWPFVKDLVSPPDINLSGETMVVDYTNGKIRSKLGIIRGMGENTIAPIVEGRPYKDIQDFVDRGVAGNSLSHKLIHVGVLDSLFPPNLSLYEKLKMYQQAVENNTYAEKVKQAKESGRKLRQLAPKEGVVPEQYINLHPIVDAEMKKATLPSMHMDLFSLGARYSKILHGFSDRPAVRNKTGGRTVLINGEQLKRLDELEGYMVEKDIYVAATCFVSSVSEFSYSNNTKRALKLVLDADSYVSEKVMWPDYKSGKLMYPSTLEKGKIVTVFFKKRAGKKDMSVIEIVVEGQ